MKTTALCTCLALLSACSSASDASDWTALFDGKSFAGWHAYQGGPLPNDAWKIEDGLLVSQSGRGEIVTDAQFGDFELEFSWRVTEAANSGVFYRVDETAEQVHHIGLEYQVLDNIGQAGRPLTEQAGACYGVVPALEDATLPVGSWNRGVILARGNRITHKMNGKVTADFEIGSDSWEQGVANGPMANLDGFAGAARGPIVLQNYRGHSVAFKDLRIRRLD